RIKTESSMDQLKVSGKGSKRSMQQDEENHSINLASAIFPGAKLVAEDRPLFCDHCDGDLHEEYDALIQDTSTPAKVLLKALHKRRANIVEAVWPDRKEWQCHRCGRRVRPCYSPSFSNNFRITAAIRGAA